MRAFAPISKDLVLVGGGHSHIEVLRKFGMRPQPGVRLTLVTRDVHTPYSGMLPGYVSGFYTYDDCHVDLVKLASYANARFVHAPASGIDPQVQQVLFRDRPPLRYDMLSINTGITPAHIVPGAAQYTIPVKPISRFVVHFEAVLSKARTASVPLAVTVVGGGAGGVELACALKHRLDQERSKAGGIPDVKVTLVSRGPVLANLAPYARHTFLKLLKERRIAVDEASGGVARVLPAKLELVNGSSLAFDDCFWCTTAGAASWVAESGLPTDKEGFLAVNDYLQSDGGPPNVFAAGDIASLTNHPCPKAGVFAVREGPSLADNLRRQLAGRPLQRFVPQRTYLNLISAGDKYCVAIKGRFGMQGKYLWGIKDYIDRTFMAKYSSDLDFDKMADEMASGAQQEPERDIDAETLTLMAEARMRCGGCGGKLPATALSVALGRLQAQGAPLGGPPVVAGLKEADDAAVLEPPGPDHLMVHTVDSFRWVVSDPYVFGRIAANHALGDCYAMGAAPVSAMAIVGVPFAADAIMEEELFLMMAGAKAVLDEAGCQLVGGHSSEAPEDTLGFSVYGTVSRGALLTKGGMRPGDVLLLTKPLGTGTILAATMRGRALGRWYMGAVHAMQQSNGLAAEVLRAHGATACTDVTGFGLLGHLAEMAAASQVVVRVDVPAVPFLPGAADCVAAAALSTLHSSNARALRAVEGAEALVRLRSWPLLVDPQTGGGLLASVPAERAQACLEALLEAGCVHAAAIGGVAIGGAQPGGKQIVAAC